MSTLHTISVSAAFALLLYAVWHVSRFIYSIITTPLNAIPGPKSTSFLYGNLKEIIASDNSKQHEAWIAEYGNTFTYHIVGQMKRLCTVDNRAMSHILNHSNEYQKPTQVRRALARILGEGVLFVEGDQHKQQRKIMNPAFGATQVRALTEIFVEKSIQLRDRWMDEYTKQSDEKGSVKIDVLSWLGKMTLDVIGLAGFNYNFDTLSPQKTENELSKAFSNMFSASQNITLLAILQFWIPILRIIPTKRERTINLAQASMRRIGLALMKESKAAIASGITEDKSNQRRDLLSLLIRANMSADIPEHLRLSDEDVLAQVPTFLAAGHETTSTGTTWALFCLTQSPDVQTKLREELLAFNGDHPTMDELNAMPYLDAVVREVLRLRSPVPSTVRVAMKDDLIPLETPFTDKKGVEHTTIKITKGDTIFIPTLVVNRDKRIWGDDGFEFKPERWLKELPAKASGIPGVWGNQMTFLSGARACIGYRFSLVEMKALLFTLVRAFEYELAVPASDIASKQNIVQRPIVLTEKEKGNQMPLLLKPYKHL